MAIQDELPAAPPQRPCWACGAVIDAPDNYCRICGKGQGDRLPWKYKPWGIIASTLVGLGPFSLFYLWRSPVISRGAKLVYTAAILLFTYLVFDQLSRLWSLFQTSLGTMPVY
jgi:hypothetical protein